MRRSRMPVRVTIHSSDVSTIFSNSALVRIRSGTYEPVPMIETVRFGLSKRGLRGCDRVIVLFDFRHDMRIDLLLDAFRRHADGILDRQRACSTRAQ